MVTLNKFGPKRFSKKWRDFAQFGRTGYMQVGSTVRTYVHWHRHQHNTRTFPLPDSTLRL
jgi:hypothetical protein